MTEYMQSDVTVHNWTLDELLDENLVIPEYQRPYTWAKELVIKFLNQINLHYERVDGRSENYPMYYLGCIVLHDDGKSLNIIDGQQRITTLLLILKIKNQLIKDLKFYHPLSFQRVKDNYNYLLSEYKKTNSFVRNIIDKIDSRQFNVSVIKTKSEDQAYSFFETLNTGGVRLSGTDILKAHHLRTLSAKNLKLFAKGWESRQSHLDNVNELLLKSRKMNALKDYVFPRKYASKSEWKIALTEEFAERTGKEEKDFGFADVIIEKNTHTIVSNKYSLRQPLNDGENYINYLLSFTDDYKKMLYEESSTELYKILNEEIINEIDGTIDLRLYYRLAMMCCVDKFGHENIEHLAFWIFRFVYSLRVGDKTRIYESTVVNHLRDSLVLERILSSYTENQLLSYLKNETFYIRSNINGVGRRFLDRVDAKFGLDCNRENYENFDEKLVEKIKSVYGK